MTCRLVSACSQTEGRQHDTIKGILNNLVPKLATLQVFFLKGDYIVQLHYNENGTGKQLFLFSLKAVDYLFKLVIFQLRPCLYLAVNISRL